MESPSASARLGMRDLLPRLGESAGKPSAPSGTVLHLLAMPTWRDMVEHEYTRSRDDEARRALEVQSASGLAMSHAALCDLRGNLAWTFPRDIAWAEFPAAPPSLYKPNAVCIVASPGGGIWPLTSPVAPILAGTSHIFIHGSSLGIRDLWRLTEILQAKGNARLHLVDDTGSREVDLPSLRNEIRLSDDGWMAADRLEYVYSLNFRALMVPAIIHAFRTAYPDGKTDFNTGPKSSEEWLDHRITGFKGGVMFRGLDHPVTLQALYRLRKTGPIRASAPTGTPAIFESGATDWMSDISWHGSGRYPSIALDTPTFGGFALGSTGLSVAGGTYGATGDERDKRFLTKAGEILLDFLPPAFEDPDVVCRWAGKPLTQEISDSIDAWVDRAFRKLKPKLDGIR